jgi:hypothetical protein
MMNSRIGILLSALKIFLVMLGLNISAGRIYRNGSIRFDQVRFSRRRR